MRSYYVRRKKLWVCLSVFLLFSFLSTICFGDKRNTKYERSLDDNDSSGVHPKKVLVQSRVNQPFGQNKKT